MNDIILFGGGLGKEITRRSGNDPKPLWSVAVMLERPGIVEEAHLDFIRAGTDVIAVMGYTPPSSSGLSQGSNATSVVKQILGRGPRMTTVNLALPAGAMA